MVINRFGKMENKHEMYIEYKKTTSEHSVKLLGIEIHNQLNFDNKYQHYAKKQVPGFLDFENTLVFPKKDSDRSLSIFKF